MKTTLKVVWGWLGGRKTYLLALLLVLTTAVLIALGKLTPEAGTAVVIFFVAAFAASYRSALQTHQAEVTALLANSAATLRDIAVKNFRAAETDGLAAVVDGYTLAEAVKVGQEGDNGGLDRTLGTLTTFPGASNPFAVKARTPAK